MLLVLHRGSQDVRKHSERVGLHWGRSTAHMVRCIHERLMLDNNVPVPEKRPCSLPPHKRRLLMRVIAYAIQNGMVLPSWAPRGPTSAAEYLQSEAAK